jgi:hypothetical protein
MPVTEFQNFLMAKFTWEIKNWCGFFAFQKKRTTAEKNFFESPPFDAIAKNGEKSTWKIRVASQMCKECADPLGLLHFSLIIVNGEKPANGHFQIKASRKNFFGCLIPVASTKSMNGIWLTKKKCPSKDIIIKVKISEVVVTTK